MRKYRPLEHAKFRQKKLRNLDSFRYFTTKLSQDGFIFGVFFFGSPYFTPRIHRIGVVFNGKWFLQYN